MNYLYSILGWDISEENNLTIGWIASWILGGYFLVAGISLIVDKMPLSSIPFFIMALLLLPPMRRFVYSKTNFKFPLYAKVISLIVLFIIFNKISDRESITYFNNNSASVLKEINILIQSREYKLAMSMSKKYLKSGNSELTKLNEIAAYKQGEIDREIEAVMKEVQKHNTIEEKTDKIAIMTFTQLLVEKRLKAPSTAKHPWGTSDYEITNLGTNRYTVSSYVDSQNGFGAMIRTNYTATIKKSGDSWRLEDLTTSP